MISNDKSDQLSVTEIYEKALSNRTNPRSGFSRDCLPNPELNNGALN